MEAQTQKRHSAFDYSASLENLDKMSPDGLFYLFRRWNEDSPEGRAKLLEKSLAFRDFATVLVSGETQRSFSPNWQHLTVAPPGVHARILDEVVPVKYLADCGSAGGASVRNLVIWCGCWRYAEDIIGYKGLVDISVN
jgi:hypothetical protein